MNLKEIKQIRQIYKTKQSLFAYPELHKKLFKEYYPQLDFSQYKNADIWFSCVFGDYCGDLMVENHDDSYEGESLFGDSPGPVG